MPRVVGEGVTLKKVFLGGALALVAVALSNDVVVAGVGLGVVAPPTADMVSDEPLIGPIATRHEIKIGGAKVPYTATFSETPLNDSSGQLQATISATA